jgi:tetratricopeptide (TPR) repeat protein
MSVDIEMPSVRPPLLVYARLLRELDDLTNRGLGDSPEAEALVDRMDTPWYAMTADEQARMRGLAADLNALREGGPKRVNMAPDESATWQRAIKEGYERGLAGDVDATLTILRRPIPSNLPRQIIPFLQARCWEKLGDLETALVFMREAERHDPSQAFSVMVLLEQLGQMDELATYARRVLADPASIPLEIYLAGVSLINPTRGVNDKEAAPLLREAANALRRAIAEHVALPPTERAQFPTDAYAAPALGLCLERLGDVRGAIAVYTDVLSRHPGDAELLMSRGLALYDQNRTAALADLNMAVRRGVRSILPFVILARQALLAGAYGEALRLAVAAVDQPGSNRPRAEAYMTIGIAQAELGQPREWVLQNFDQALALDPANQVIKENRDLATALPTAKSRRPARARRPQQPVTPSDWLRRDRGRDILNRWETLTEQRGGRSSGVERLISVQG